MLELRQVLQDPAESVYVQSARRIAVSGFGWWRGQDERVKMGKPSREPELASPHSAQVQLAQDERADLTQVRAKPRERVGIQFSSLDISSSLPSRRRRYPRPLSLSFENKRLDSSSTVWICCYDLLELGSCVAGTQSYIPKMDGEGKPPRDKREGDGGGRRRLGNSIVEDSLEHLVGQPCQHQR